MPFTFSKFRVPAYFEGKVFLSFFLKNTLRDISNKRFFLFLTLGLLILEKRQNRAYGEFFQIFFNVLRTFLTKHLFFFNFRVMAS